MAGLATVSLLFIANSEKSGQTRSGLGAGVGRSSSSIEAGRGPTRSRLGAGRFQSRGTAGAGPSRTRTGSRSGLDAGSRHRDGVGAISSDLRQTESGLGSDPGRARRRPARNAFCSARFLPAAHSLPPGGLHLLPPLRPAR